MDVVLEKAIEDICSQQNQFDHWFVERIKELARFEEEDEAQQISIGSLGLFVQFIGLRTSNLKPPQIVLTPEACIQAEWKDNNNQFVHLKFYFDRNHAITPNIRATFRFNSVSLLNVKGDLDSFLGSVTGNVESINTFLDELGISKLLTE